MKLYRLASLFRPFQKYQIVDIEEMYTVYESWYITGDSKLFQSSEFSHYDVVAIQPEGEKLVIFVTD